MTKEAHYQCVKCFYEWKQKPGMVQCPMCNLSNVVRLNFKDDLKRGESATREIQSETTLRRLLARNALQ